MDPPIRRILTASDFSDHSERATAYAAALARQLRVDLLLLHVVEPTLYGSPFMTAPVADMAVEFQKIARSTLETAANLIRQAGTNVEVLVETGAPWHEIIEVAKRHQANLIVIGTHGRHGLSRALIGSIAEKIVRWSPIPVLAVPITEAALGKNPSST